MQANHQNPLPTTRCVRCPLMATAGGNRLQRTSAEVDRGRRAETKNAPVASASTICLCLPCSLIGFDALLLSRKIRRSATLVIDIHHHMSPLWDAEIVYYFRNTSPNSLVLWVAMGIDGHSCAPIVGSKSAIDRHHYWSMVKNSGHRWIACTIYCDR